MIAIAMGNVGPSVSKFQVRADLVGLEQQVTKPSEQGLSPVGERFVLSWTLGDNSPL